MQALYDVFGGRIISSDIWPAHSADLNHCDSFFFGCLKDTVYNSNPRKEGLEDNIHKKFKNIPAEEFQRINQNLFRRCEECVRVERTAFSTPPVLCDFHSKPYRSTAILIRRKIHIRLAFSGASANKGKNLLVQVGRTEPTRNPGGQPLGYASIEVNSIGILRDVAHILIHSVHQVHKLGILCRSLFRSSDCSNERIRASYSGNWEQFCLLRPNALFAA
jgi:hypothetical protein